MRALGAAMGGARGAAAGRPRLPAARPEAEDADKAARDPAYQAIRAWLYESAGIDLARDKRALVRGRLAPRLRYFGLEDYGQYFELVRSGAHPGEAQIAIDLLTTNETHFFREPKHFDFLRERILPARASGRMFRAWSAACSSGEEAYSLAMTLGPMLGVTPWEVLGSDLSTRVLAKARAGHYPIERSKSIPQGYLHKYCLRGIGAQHGTFLVDPQLRQRVHFRQLNLVEPLPAIGEFDVVFLRNVMIYFDMPTRRGVVGRIVERLRPGGCLFVGHSESLHGISDRLRSVAPSVYRKS